MSKTGQYLTPFQRKLLQKGLQEELSKSYRQRLEIMLLADDGVPQTEICQSLGCCPATVRHWMHIARAGMAHKWRDCPIGRPKIINDAYAERLRDLLNQSPRDYGYSFRRWTVNWLAKQLAKEFGIELSDRSVKRLMKQMGLSTLPKTGQPNEDLAQSIQRTKISIRDLTFSTLLDDSEFLPIHLNLSETDIHGATSTRIPAFSATVRKHLGSVPIRLPVPSLS